MLQNKGIVTAGILGLTAAEWGWLLYECPVEKRNAFVGWLWENKTNTKVLTVLGLTLIEACWLIYLYTHQAQA